MESNPQSRPRLGWGRAGLRRKMKFPMQIQTQIQTYGVDQVKEKTLPKQKEVEQPPLTKLTTDRSIGHMPETCIIPDYTFRSIINTRKIQFYPDPLIKPTPRLPDRKMQDNRRMTLDLDLDINKDFQENSTYKEGIISETYQRPGKCQLLEPPELEDLIYTNNLVQKYLLKLTDIDKILKIIQRKVLKGTHLPVTIKEIQAGYLNSPHL